jgi:DNA repair ATPase RecN
MREIEFGHFTINFPDESAGYFSIFEDLADFFGVEVQSEAFELLRTELKKIELKPKPNLDFESDFTQIDSKSAETIFEVAKVVHKLTLPAKRVEIQEKQLEEIYRRLKNWKRPPRQKWKNWRCIFNSSI